MLFTDDFIDELLEDFAELSTLDEVNVSDFSLCQYVTIFHISCLITQKIDLVDNAK